MADNKLQGKVAIVTGGASGIGEATARRFADRGARAVVIADIQDEKGLNIAASIGLEVCAYVHCDVSDEEQVKTLVQSTVEKYGRLDVMFSNAGITSLADQTILDFDFAAYEKLFAVNVRGMATSVKHAARAMVEERVRGSIICTASVVASMGTPLCTDYTMSKLAVVGLVRSASLQLAGHGIRVNSVSPGTVGTPLLREMFGIGENVDLDEFVESCSRLKGVMRAKNVADAVVFLASEDSEFVTGHDLVVDGGFFAAV
ncbi:Momilactone A synthase [Morus notabilis]|uniref:Momilactone A synthase n=1 Tax=Morus notabilis TaxID=981085 RepID=W9SZB8_9ROSA|nr:(-)-isopiperitenol/(-)-carveol dehydrogenase, mitochondrial [Morus notabilis]EXC34230.1 Momilactone A synthase [Morus notabilis]